MFVVQEPVVVASCLIGGIGTCSFLFRALIIDQFFISFDRCHEIICFLSIVAHIYLLGRSYLNVFFSGILYSFGCEETMSIESSFI